MAVIATLALAGLAQGCSSDSSSSFNTSKAFDIFTIQKRDSAVLPAEDAGLGRTGPVAPEELVDAAGQCVGGPAPVAVAATPEAAAPGGAAANTPGIVPEGQQPLLGGVALGMTECDVVRRAGQPGNVVISADDKNERLTVLTYLTGNWPGIYRFSVGRLKVVERAPEPPAPPKPVRKKPVKKKPVAKPMPASAPIPAAGSFTR